MHKQVKHKSEWHICIRDTNKLHKFYIRKIILASSKVIMPYYYFYIKESLSYRLNIKLRRIVCKSRLSSIVISKKNIVVQNRA